MYTKSEECLLSLRRISVNLTNPNELKNILGAYGFSFSKSLGQNFLIDKNVLDKIVSGSGINGEWGALEIGPGAGTLTYELAKNSGKTVAVEIDKRLMPLLGYTLNEFKNVKVINADVMGLDLDALIKAEFADMPVAVCANLPYYITTPIIMKILEECKNVRTVTVMIQKEVADRMAASPGGKDYGALSVAVQFYTKPEIICRAEPHCFIPQPKVASTVIRLDVLKEPAVSVKNQKLFFDIVKSAFGQRRKTLLNALSKSPYLDIEKGKIIAAIEKSGLAPDVRGERLSIEQFAALADFLE